MQNNQIVQVNIDLEDLHRLYHLLGHEVLKPTRGSRSLRFHDDAAYFRGYFSSFLDQPDGVGRSPVQPSGAVDQVTIYPFVVGE